MTLKDKGLINMAKSASPYDHDFIISLISKAESEECRVRLTQMADESLKLFDSTKSELSK